MLWLSTILDAFQVVSTISRERMKGFRRSWSKSTRYSKAQMRPNVGIARCSSFQVIRKRTHRKNHVIMNSRCLFSLYSAYLSSFMGNSKVKLEVRHIILQFQCNSSFHWCPWSIQDCRVVKKRLIRIVQGFGMFEVERDTKKKSEKKCVIPLGWCCFRKDLIPPKIWSSLVSWNSRWNPWYVLISQETGAGSPMKPLHRVGWVGSIATQRCLTV